MKWIDQTYINKWPQLWQLVQKECLLHVEFAYVVEIAGQKSEAAAAITCLLLIAARKGHLCIKIEQDSVSPSLEELILDPTLCPSLEKLIRKGTEGRNRFYLPKYFSLETQIIEQLLRLAQTSLPVHQPVDVAELTQEQNQAVNNALQLPISLILGGPGTGKTFTAGHIVKQFLAKGSSSIILTAPTGKAAAHLADKIHQDLPSIRYGTLHSQLGLRSFVDVTQERTWLDADLVIVDECSMIDAAVFFHLLASISPETHLVLMGDFHQLPSIEGGAVFRDLAESFLPKTTLSTIHRSNRSEIIQLAEAILTGNVQEINNIDLGFQEGNKEKIMNNLWERGEKQFPIASDPKEWFEKLEQFRILSTLRKGPLGVDAINAFFYEKFSKKTNYFPIIITRNDTKKTGLCNGDIGVLIRDKGAIFQDGKEIDVHELPSYEYAYCLSVHKSQGSEYKEVLLLVPQGSEGFGREILYTAVTRAKEKIEIDGHVQEMMQALKKKTERVSSISERLNEVLCAI